MQRSAWHLLLFACGGTGFALERHCLEHSYDGYFNPGVMPCSTVKRQKKVGKAASGSMVEHGKEKGSKL